MIYSSLAQANFANKFGIAKKTIFFLTIFCWGGFVVSTSASALSSEKLSNAPANGGFVVGPGSYAVEGEPGEVITKTIQITNEKGEDDRVAISVEDFQGSSNPDASVDLKGKASGSHGAREWIFPEVSQLDIPAGQRYFVDITITIPQNADAGDHYAAVLVSNDTKDGDDKKMSSKNVQKPNVKITTRVGVLFYVKVHGKVTEEGEVKSFDVLRPWYEKLPVDFNVLFKNTGTVRLETFGKIEIRNMFNRQVATLDLEKFNTFRDSSRNRKVTWSDDQWHLGLYEATLTLNRGYGNIEDVKKVSFWILPWKMLLVGLLGLVAIILAAVLISRLFSINIRIAKKR